MPPVRQPTSALPLKPAVFLVLLVLSEGDAHGYRIKKNVEQRSDGEGKTKPEERACEASILPRRIEQEAAVTTVTKNSYSYPFCTDRPGSCNISAKVFYRFYGQVGSFYPRPVFRSAPQPSQPALPANRFEEVPDCTSGRIFARHPDARHEVSAGFENPSHFRKHSSAFRHVRRALNGDYRIKPIVRQIVL